MRSVIVLCLIIGVALASTQWEYFKTKYNKTYENVDVEHYRYTVFQANLKRAAAFQKSQGPNGATFGVTKFSDLTEEEFRKDYLLPKDFAVTYNPQGPEAFVDNKIGLKADPKNWNWFNHGVCTPIYNQGQCGSCWAFSATETIESWWALGGHALTQLSMEQIVDCDTTCYGCSGGWPYLAYEYVESVAGIDSYNSYPYTAEDGQAGTCAYNAGNVAAHVTGYTSVPQGEANLYRQAQTGPVSVCVDASSWSAYTGGVLTSCTSNVDHCVQLVGYQNYNPAGNDQNSYWLVRNSWGADWGVNGFIWIETGLDLCAIGDYATVPTV